MDRAASTNRKIVLLTVCQHFWKTVVGMSSMPGELLAAILNTADLSSSVVRRGLFIVDSNWGMS